MIGRFMLPEISFRTLPQLPNIGTDDVAFAGLEVRSTHVHLGYPAVRKFLRSTSRHRVPRHALLRAFPRIRPFPTRAPTDMNSCQ